MRVRAYMKATVQQTAFATALDSVCKGISKDNTNPIYGGVLIEVDDGVMNLTSMNSTRSIKCSIQAFVEDPGAAVLPGELLSKTVSKMPDSPILLVSDGTGMFIRCERARLRLNSLEVRRFSEFPHVETSASISVPTPLFVTMANKACRYVMREQAGRPECMGIHIVAGDGVLRMQATDSYRFFEARAEVDAGAFDAIVDVESIRDMAKMAPSDTVEIGVSDHQVTLASGSVSYVGRAIYGRFPNIDMVMPESFSTTIVVDPSELMASLSRLEGIAKQNGKVELSLSESTVTLRASSPDSGEAFEELDVEASGDDVRVPLAFQFLLDGLRSMGDTVTLGFNGPRAPSIMQSTDGCDVTHFMMPTAPFGVAES